MSSSTWRTVFFRNSAAWEGTRSLMLRRLSPGDVSKKMRDQSTQSALNLNHLKPYHIPNHPLWGMIIISTSMFSSCPQQNLHTSAASKVSLAHLTWRSPRSSHEVGSRGAKWPRLGALHPHFLRIQKQRLARKVSWYFINKVEKMKKTSTKDIFNAESY